MTGTMTIADGLLMEVSMETETTKRHFANIKPEHFDYTPHEKSMNMIALASHVIESAFWADEIINKDVFEFDPSTYEPKVAGSIDELIAMADDGVKACSEALAGKADADLFAPWKMIAGGKTVMEGVPKVGVFRSFVLNHMIHHRGQLTVYLRMNDVPVAQTYGPSADFPKM